MDVSSAQGVGQAYAVRVEKLAQNAAKAEGEAAVQLIENATPPPTGLHGEGAHINIYG